MPSHSSGRIVQSRKGKAGTAHQKNHRWESFSNKISKLHSLDPLRKVRRHDLDTEDLKVTTSYFKNALEKWADLNISSGFTSFRREVLAVSDSLAQILHFEGKIMDTLEKYISAQEKESLEALLDTLTAFAHDLGSRFEKHYPRALRLIASIASRRHDADVIEWTFASLAFLFKYLARLIVPDIRPTYDVMVPLLGKARNPPYMARFAAEALSFLIKKAAAPSGREKSLRLIIEHAQIDLETFRGDRQYELYYHGLMTMFAEAIKGQGHTIHTTGPAILQALIQSVSNEECYSERNHGWADLVCGVHVSLVHHTTPETFAPIAQAVVEQASDEISTSYPLRNILYVKLLGIMCGVRKGNRVAEDQWHAVLKSLGESLNKICSDLPALVTVARPILWNDVLVNVAIVCQSAPLDVQFITTLTKLLTRDPLMTWFIPFCSYLSDLDAAKFRSLFLKPFQKFVATHWSEGANEEMLCVLLPRMVESRALPSSQNDDSFTLPPSWQNQIVSKFERLEVSPFPERGASAACDNEGNRWRDRCLPKYAALLHVLECTKVQASTNAPLADLLGRKLKLALRPSQSLATEEACFIVSQGFSAYLRMCQSVGQLDKSLRPLLRAAAPRFCRLTGFLEAMLAYEQQLDAMRSPHTTTSSSASPETEDNPLLDCLIDNLASQSSDHRLASLMLLSKLEMATDQLGLLAIMLQTEQTPLDLQNARAISVHVRKLGATYAQVDESSWLRRAVPSFLFGIMTVRLMPVWDSAVEALQQIAETKSGEEALSRRAFEWLKVPSKRWGGHQVPATGPSFTGLTDFECLNLMQLRKKASGAQEVMDDASAVILRWFDDRQQLVPERPSNARSQALKVLTVTPQIAERRSRVLVPLFLSWALDMDEQVEASDEDEHLDTRSSWSLPDRKAMLAVICQFNNPRAVFQNAKVYDALLKLLANGDGDIQKAALKAILAWKQPGVKPYQENLQYLLDEARFKNELTVLFQGDHQIQPEHRSEMMPVLLRLLYGRTISKKGVASGRGGLQATRLAVLRHLNVEDMGCFLNIALGDLGGVQVVEASSIREDVFRNVMLPGRKQAGSMKMMLAIINELGTSVSSYTRTILDAVLYCLVFSCRKLADDGEEAEEEGEALLGSETALLRTTRTTSLKCIIALLRNAPAFNWEPYKDALIREVVSPRIEKLPIENSQGVSGILHLLSTLSASPNTALVLAIDERIVGKLAECLSVDKAKDEVKIFALGIIRNLVKLAQAPATESTLNELIGEELLHPNLDAILGRISGLLRCGAESGRDLLAATVETVVQVSPLVHQSGNTAELLDISVFLLRQPSRRVNPKVKSNVLAIIESFLHLEKLAPGSDLRERIYTTVASLFSFFRDRPNREALSRVLTVFAGEDAAVLQVAGICVELNSYASGRLDEPDYNRRVAAYNALTRPRDRPLTAREWEPLLHNMLFHIKNDEEYGILSTNSADGICQFVEAAAASADDEKELFFKLLSDVVMPAIYSGAREASETVRREIVRVLGFMVSRLPTWAPVSDLVGLDPPPDEQDSDPSFFSHILSPATSRQMRALQLLSKVCHHSELGSRNIAHFLIPLLEHFMLGREEGTDDHGVGAQAATTVADLAMSLEWPQYRSLLRRYIGYIVSKTDCPKQLVRLLGKVVDSIAAAAVERREDGMEIDSPGEKVKKHRLAATMPVEEKLTQDIVTNILPPLLAYMHEKDETLISARVPVGSIIVGLLKLLPSEKLEQILPGVLTDICHILRSKAWESREMARHTLSKMTRTLGASSFGFVLDELRGALTKGYQLHVLSYTLHSILVAVIPHIEPGELDYCIDKIMAVIMDDIFGATGQEKEADEYTSQMKEVKSRKSQDSMELLTRTISINHLVELVQPLQQLLVEKLNQRLVNKIDGLLSRISNGLLANPAAESRDTLVFCYEVIQRAYQSDKAEVATPINARLGRYLIQKGAKKSGDRGATVKHTSKLVRFALDVLCTIWKKHDSLRNAVNITGFLGVIGDAVVGAQEEVKTAAFKLLTALVRVPFKTEDWTKLYWTASREAVKSLSLSTSTTTDLAQEALKLLSVTLRDRRDVSVKDGAIDMLLGKLKDDLTEPQLRHVTFRFLRCVLDRRVETAATYDTLDYVGRIMITNDDRDTRDLARGAFFQFLREYPQTGKRWGKQLSFVMANLNYDREGGRLSTMEVIHLLLMKAGDFAHEVGQKCFVQLFLLLGNDDSEKCRLAAGQLIKEIFQKADKEGTSKLLTFLRDRLSSDKEMVLRLVIQTFGYYFEARDASSRDLRDVGLLINRIVAVLEDYSTFAQDWELINSILQTVPILILKQPSTVLAHERLWHAIAAPMSSPNEVVKLSSVRLLNVYLTDFYDKNKGTVGRESVVGSYGLVLDKDAVQALVILAVAVLSPGAVARWKRRMAKRGAETVVEVEAVPKRILPADLDESLASEVVRVLAMLARFLDPKPSASDASESGDEGEDDKEDEEWAGIEDTERKAQTKVTLHTLFTFLSNILMAETTARSSALVPKMAAMELMTLYTSTLSPEVLAPSLNIILTPLHHLTDPHITVPTSLDDGFKTGHEALRTKAEEVTEVLRSRMGTESYTREVLAVRETARHRRVARQRKRKIEAVVEPDRYGRWKRGRLDRKVKRRKEKGVENRDRRWHAGGA